MDNNLSLSFLSDLLSHHLCSLNIATEHHHLGAPPAHVQGGELADASVAPRDRHNLPFQPCFAAALGPLQDTVMVDQDWLRFTKPA